MEGFICSSAGCWCGSCLFGGFFCFFYLRWSLFASINFYGSGSGLNSEVHTDHRRWRVSSTCSNLSAGAASNGKKKNKKKSNIEQSDLFTEFSSMHFVQYSCCRTQRIIALIHAPPFAVSLICSGLVSVDFVSDLNLIFPQRLVENAAVVRGKQQQQHQGGTPRSCSE